MTSSAVSVNRTINFFRGAWATLIGHLRDRESQGPILFVLSSAFKSVIQMATGLIATRLVLPQDIGTWQKFAILETYLLIASLGVQMALNREYAYYRGAEDDEAALRSAGVALSATVIWSLINLGFIIALLVYFGMQQSSQKTMLGLTLYTIPATFTPFFAYFTVIFRSGDEFNRLGQIQFFETFFLIVSLGLVFLGGWIGLFVRYATIPLLGVVLRYVWRPIPIQLNWDWNIFLRLVRLGLKLLVLNYVYGLLLVADRTLIATRMGTEALGYYAIALTAQTAISTLPLSLSQIIYTRMTYRYGQTGTPQSLKRITFLPVIYNAIFLIVPGIILMALLNPFITHFLPNYTSGIPAAQLMVVAGYLLCLNTSASVFSTLDRLLPYTILVTVSLGIMYVSGILATEFWGTIESIAAAKVISIAFLVVGNNILAYILIRERNEESSAARR
jgi:O-antigen/teichoic acid export membrane protein